MTGNKSFVPLRNRVEFVAVWSFTVCLDNCFIHVFTEKGVGHEPIRNQDPWGH